MKKTAAILLLALLSARAFAIVDIYTIDKIVFTDSELRFTIGANTVVQYPLGDVRSIVFYDGHPSALPTDTADHVSIYPNPSADIIHFRGEAEGYSYSIVNLTGAVVAQGFGLKADVSTLPAGTYIIKIENLTAKIIKR